MDVEKQEDGPSISASNGPDPELTEENSNSREVQATSSSPRTGWRKFFDISRLQGKRANSTVTETGDEDTKARPAKWSMGVLNDKYTIEVPGSILLLSEEKGYNAPLGLSNTPDRRSSSSLPISIRPARPPLRSLPSGVQRSNQGPIEEKKKTADGQIILEPQPDDSLNDPLNWPSWRRDIALLSLGFYCMMGGGMTPILAAGYQNVSDSYNVPYSKIALTTGFYTLGLGVGSVFASPTAILFGKRPVYLYNIILFIISAVWCALSPNYISLVIGRVFMGLAVSPVECLPSATIAEIYFLHERAYRLGIYTLLLLSGKNLIPLVSAAIIQSLDWQWVFWITALVVGFCFGLIFFFVPETFWDRTPIPHQHHFTQAALASLSSVLHRSVSHDYPTHDKDGPSSSTHHPHGSDGPDDIRKLALENATAEKGQAQGGTIAQRRKQRPNRVGFTDQFPAEDNISIHSRDQPNPIFHGGEPTRSPLGTPGSTFEYRPARLEVPKIEGASSNLPRPLAYHSDSWRVEPRGGAPKTPGLHNLNSPYYLSKDSPKSDSFANEHNLEDTKASIGDAGSMTAQPGTAGLSEKSPAPPPEVAIEELPATMRYTHELRTQPPKTFVQNLRPWNGRLRDDKWLKVAVRPFILFAYPSILWSALVYSLSIGWLIVLSESVSEIYRNRSSYNFSALGVGLVYISPFIGGILGSAVAGKVSDIVVRFMSRRNGGVYEPEFRLIMAIPITISSVIGLMGFGWSAQEKDLWIVPTVFFGIISFGCALGSTVSISFAVDSYRQYAGEALVTLNFSKNIFHGLAFSLFFPNWLSSDGPKSVFIYVGVIQLICLVTTIPMYIFGKRARMWTVRKNLMEKF